MREFKYLGSTLQEDGETSREVERRKTAGWHAWRNMLGILCDGRVHLYIKGKIYKVVVIDLVVWHSSNINNHMIGEES